MAEQGQAETQPALQVPEGISQMQAVEHITQILEKENTPRDEQGRFLPKAGETETPAPAEAPAEEAPAEAPSEEAEITPEPRRFKLKYKGEELEKDEEEVVSLAQQGFDYTQKSQALAKEREEMSAKVQTEVEQRRKEYEQKLEIHKKAIEKMAGVDDMDLNKLALEDPTRAQQEFFKRLQFQQTLQGIEAEQQRIAQERFQNLQQSVRKQAEASVETLQREIPEWSNELYGKVLKGAAKDYGFEQKELNAITDHRAIKVLHDAMKYRELMAAKPKTVDKRVAAVPKVTKPGTSEKSDPKASRIQERMANLTKTGRKEDAQAIFQEMIEQGKL